MWSFPVPPDQPPGLFTPRLLLVYPPITRQERYSSNLGIFGGRQIPLGIFSLAAYIRQAGMIVDVIDAEARDLEEQDILDHLAQGGFNVLGISTTTVAWHRSQALARAVRQRLPGVTIVVGGPHVSTQPIATLATGEDFDYAIPHEGEETLLALLHLLQQGGSPATVAGLVFRQDGQVVVNPPRPAITDLDSLPFPALDLIADLDLYSPPPFNYRQRPVANIITSRGCPGQCTFCENSTFGRHLRLRSARHVVDEIQMLITQRGVKEITFVDDTFTANRKRLREIFQLTAERGLHFPWSCMSRINTVNRELLAFMKEHGCWYISFGIESANPAILKEIRKNIQPTQVIEVIQACAELGIRTKGFFMVGNPLESEATLDETIAFACSIPLDHVVVTVNTPMPGSQQFQQASQYGTLHQEGWHQFNYWNAVFVPHGMTREVLLAKHREFLRRFYGRPGRMMTRLFRLLRDPATPGHVGQMLAALWRYWLRSPVQRRS